MIRSPVSLNEPWSLQRSPLAKPVSSVTGRLGAAACSSRACDRWEPEKTRYSRNRQDRGQQQQAAEQCSRAFLVLPVRFGDPLFSAFHQAVVRKRHKVAPYPAWRAISNQHSYKEIRSL